MLRLIALTVLVASFVLAGCAQKPPTQDPTTGAGDVFEGDAGPDPAQIVSGVGQVVHIDLEGGFYGLVADDSTKYNPLNLGEEPFKQYQEDGLRVRFRAVKRTDVMTTRMWGQNVDLLDMLPIATKQE